VRCYCVQALPPLRFEELSRHRALHCLLLATEHPKHGDDFSWKAPDSGVPFSAKRWQSRSPIEHFSNVAPAEASACSSPASAELRHERQYVSWAEADVGHRPCAHGGQTAHDFVAAPSGDWCAAGRKAATTAAATSCLPSLVARAAQQAPCRRPRRQERSSSSATPHYCLRVRGIADRQVPAHLAASGRVAMACTRKLSPRRRSAGESFPGGAIAGRPRAALWGCRQSSGTCFGRSTTKVFPAHVGASIEIVASRSSEFERSNARGSPASGSVVDSLLVAAYGCALSCLRTAWPALVLRWASGRTRSSSPGRHCPQARIRRRGSALHWTKS
jgi:hypothetical protein